MDALPDARAPLLIALFYQHDESKPTAVHAASCYSDEPAGL